MKADVTIYQATHRPQEEARKIRDLLGEDTDVTFIHPRSRLFPVVLVVRLPAWQADDNRRAYKRLGWTINRPPMLEF